MRVLSREQRLLYKGSGNRRDRYIRLDSAKSIAGDPNYHHDQHEAVSGASSTLLHHARFRDSGKGSSVGEIMGLFFQQREFGGLTQVQCRGLVARQFPSAHHEKRQFIGHQEAHLGRSRPVPIFRICHGHSW